MWPMVSRVRTANATEVGAQAIDYD